MHNSNFQTKPDAKRLTAKPRMVKCKVCKKPYLKERMSQIACGLPCAVVAGQQITAKAVRKLYAARREALKSRSQWLADAQVAFNAFIRARDAHLPCISCGRDNESKINAGHYLSVGARPELRFNEDNCHKQCEHCNTYKSGNQAAYRPRLIERIGAARVEALEGPHPPAKWSIEDIKTIKATYKLKLKELKKAAE